MSSTSDIEKEYNEFIKTDSGKEWVAEYESQKLKADLGYYVYDFHAEMLDL